MTTVIETKEKELNDAKRNRDIGAYVTFALAAGSFFLLGPEGVGLAMIIVILYLLGFRLSQSLKIRKLEKEFSEFKFALDLEKAKTEQK